MPIRSLTSRWVRPNLPIRDRILARSASRWSMQAIYPTLASHYKKNVHKMGTVILGWE